MATRPLRDDIATIIQQGSEHHELTAETVIEALIAASRQAFIPNTTTWLEEIKAGKEFRIR